MLIQSFNIGRKPFYFGVILRNWKEFVESSGYQFVSEVGAKLSYSDGKFTFTCDKYTFPPKKVSIKQCSTPREYCIYKFSQKHGDYYDYSLFEWTGNVADKGLFVCPKHGVFYQAINGHLRGSGCFKCFGSEKLTTEIVKARCLASRGDAYDYSDMKYSPKGNMITIRCKRHGVFTTNYYSHLKGVDCSNCANEASVGRVIPTEDFAEKARLIHGDTYLYDKSNYKGAKIPITITCKVHGDFEQIPNYHLTGNGCQKCGREKTGYTRTSYINACKDGSNVYLIKMQDDSEVFYKIGISKDVSARVRGLKCETSYNVSVEYFKYFKEPSVVFDLERLLHREFNSINYKPKQRFSGETECFKLENTDIAVKLFNCIA